MDDADKKTIADSIANSQTALAKLSELANEDQRGVAMAYAIEAAKIVKLNGGTKMNFLDMVAAAWIHTEGN